MKGKLIVVTGFDGSGTTSLAAGLCGMDPAGVLMKTPDGPFQDARAAVDVETRTAFPEAHYLFYLASVAYASRRIQNELLARRNVYCVRYLIDTVVSHRAHGLAVDLNYVMQGVEIVRPDVTLFVRAREEIRQERISARGKGELDRVLDDDGARTRFMEEFARYQAHYVVVDNSGELADTVEAAISFLPWLQRTNA